jgi:hypothetical protein
MGFSFAISLRLLGICVKGKRWLLNAACVDGQSTILRDFGAEVAACPMSGLSFPLGWV